MPSGKRASISILFSHPEIQHSHQMAAGLAAAGLLDRYIHGAAPPRYMEANIPPHLRRRVHWFQPLRRAASKMLPHGPAGSAHQVLRDLYDREVARALPAFSCNAVVAYELTAGRTFEAAKRRGMACILDASSVHHATQTRLDPTSNTPGLITRKEREVALADLIITCSTLARDTYVAAGVPPAKVVPVSLGVDVDVFGADAAEAAKVPSRDGRIVFCNAGSLQRRKGTDLMVLACRALRARSLPYDFIIAGNHTGADRQIVRDLSEVARLRGRLPHEELGRFYAEADVFVLPSRFDSFGMVVSEALACGKPVIVSDTVGAKDLVREGVNGWVIPVGDASALVERMAWCAENPAAVRAMSAAARASAVKQNWDVYRREVSARIRGFLEDWRRRAAA